MRLRVHHNNLILLLHGQPEIARLRDKNMVMLDGREVLDAVGE